MRHHSPVARTPPASIAQRLMEPLTVMESFDVLRDGELGLGLTLDEEKGTKKRGRESLLDHRFAAPAPAALNSGPATSSFTRSGCQNRSSNNDSRPLSFRDLTGYYKLYAAKKSIRIVYRIIDQKILVEVVAIGKREDLAVYQEALKRFTHQDR